MADATRLEDDDPAGVGSAAGAYGKAEFSASGKTISSRLPGATSSRPTTRLLT